MIAYKGRESKRAKFYKMPKNIQMLYKEGKCRDCSVVVTRMDFAKILGKFTKVKIQYESSSTPKIKKVTEVATPNSNARLKNNENGMVLLHRTAYNKHPVKELVNSVSKKSKPRQINNVLKENNGSNKTEVKDNFLNHTVKEIRKQVDNKHYAIIFNDPLTNNNNEFICNYSLMELLPNVDKSILPSEEWCIDCFPKNEEPTDDKVYDRIAAELEDLMYNEKPEGKQEKSEPTENKVDEFPSIMDILNDNTNTVNNSELKDQSSNIEFKDNLESSDVEAMLLGNQSASNEKVNDDKIIEQTPMEVDNSDVSKLIEDVAQLNPNNDLNKTVIDDADDVENPHSPSILDEALQKGIEEHLPCDPPLKADNNIQDVPCDNETSENVTTEEKSSTTIEKVKEVIDDKQIEKPPTKDEVQNVLNIPSSIEKQPTKDEVQNGLNIPSSTKLEDVTHIIFKKVINGTCQKSVTCPKNLKYSIELEGKTVEFLGAPKYISSLEDLQVLLQIVNETDIKSLYVLQKNFCIV